MKLLLLLALAQDRGEIAEAFQRLRAAYESKGSAVTGEKRAQLNQVLTRAFGGDSARLLEGLGLAREIVDGKATTVRVAPTHRVLQVGVAAQAGFRIHALAKQEGKATVRVFNARDEVVIKMEAEYGAVGSADLSEQAEGIYWLEAGGIRAQVQLVRDLDARLKKMNAELPGDRTAPVAASLDGRVRLLLEAKDGKPVEFLGDVAAELRELEDDVDVFLDGRDPYALKKHGHQRRAVTIDKTPVAYRVYVPKSVDLTKKPPLVVALHGTGASENFWLEGTKLAELADAKGFVVVAPRAGGASAPLQVGAVVAQALEDLPVGSVWLLGHSTGGGLALELAAAGPKQFAGVIAFAPTGRTDLKRLKGLEVYVACGGRDGLIESVRAMTKAVEGQKGLTYEERPDLEHLTIVWETLGAALERVK